MTETNNPGLPADLPDDATWHASILRAMAQDGAGYYSQNDILRLNRAADYLERRVAEEARMTMAIEDAVNRPMGVVPASAEPFVTAAGLAAAGQRRPRA